MKTAPHFSNIKLTRVQLESLYSKLVEMGLIDSSCPQNEFVYYMTGYGDSPASPLLWLGSKTLLAIYIDEMRDKTLPVEWNRVDTIFLGCKGKTLEGVLRAPMQKNANRSFDTFFANKKVVHSLIENL